jgi:cytochrome oxidase Cu insertion factor (SCO1/SenC/PrrC family)
VDAVEAVVAGWQIGTEAAESGQIEHTLVSYLLDDRGRIVHRYRSTNSDPTVVRADIEALVAAIDKAAPGG